MERKVRGKIAESKITEITKEFDELIGENELTNLKIGKILGQIWVRI